MSKSGRGRPYNVKPVALRIAADFLTPVSAFLRLRRAAVPAFLLESVEQGQRGARYSYLGVEPFEILKVQGGALEVRAQGVTSVIPGDPLRALTDRLGRYRAARAPELPPFPGGAVGYVGFGAVRYLEPVLARSIAAAPMDVPDIFLMMFRSIVCFDHQTAQAYLIVNALLDHAADAEAQAEKEAAALLERLRHPCPEEQALLQPLSPLALSAQASAVPELGAERFCAAVQTIKGHIRRGDIFQCVLSERFRLPVRTDPLAIYRASATRARPLISSICRTSSRSCSAPRPSCSCRWSAAMSRPTPSPAPARVARPPPRMSSASASSCAAPRSGPST